MSSRRAKHANLIRMMAERKVFLSAVLDSKSNKYSKEQCAKSKKKFSAIELDRALGNFVALVLALIFNSSKAGIDVEIKIIANMEGGRGWREKHVTSL